MLLQRIVSTAVRLYPRYVVTTALSQAPKLSLLTNNLGLGVQRQFSTILNNVQQHPVPTGLLHNPKLVNLSNNIITRSVTKYSWKRGKRKTVKTVLQRFYRLNWGGWIRTKCGRNKRLWRKRAARKRRLRQHVLCNATQSTLLDKMVNMSWKKPKYYVDDPYEPYHSREECRFTYTKPKPYFPPENETI